MISGLEIFSLKNRTILVSGASRGLGFYLAQGLVNSGANVIGLSRSKAPDDAKFTYQQCDITDPLSFQKIINGIIKQSGHIDGYLHVSGITIPTLESPQSSNDFRTTVNTNLIASYECCSAIGKIMQQQRQGSIAIVTSIGSFQAFPDNPGYVASKGGLRMLSKSLASDLGAYNVRVNALAPGYFVTDMTKGSYEDPIRQAERTDRTMLRRWGHLDELVGAAIFLLSDASSYMTGVDLVVDGGWTAKGL